MSTFEAGQRWTYRTRASDPQSTLVIGAVEIYPQHGEVVHISVEGVASPTSPEPLFLGHMPFSEQAVRSSVVAPTDRGVPAHEHLDDGIAEWRRVEGGVFTLGVAEAVDAVVGSIDPTTQHDPFDDLVAEMRTTYSTELTAKVYDELFRLPRWIFIAAPNGASAVMAWVFPDGPVTTPAGLAFTSTAKATAAAKQLGLTDEAGNADLISMTVEDVVARTDGDGLGVDWFCFNMTHQEFPLVANQVGKLYRSRIN